jgi:hypothetical protein
MQAHRPPCTTTHTARLALLAGLLLFAATACSYYDPVPGTVHLKTVLNGEPQSCMVQVFNAQGNQVQQDGVNDGHVDVEKLAPGSYTLKFLGFDNQPYPAVRSVKLFEAGEINLTVELSAKDAPPPDEGTPASSS